MMDTIGADAPFPNLRGGDSVLVIGGTGMLAPAVGDLLAAGVRFVRLWGSGGGDPRQAAVTAAPLPGRKVSEVFLGSLMDSHGVRRWLSHREISDGTLAALRGGASRTVIGDYRAGNGL
ncbi:hypothetical protein ACUH88_08195 [Dermabacteraceae bacterium P13095]